MTAHPYDALRDRLDALLGRVADYEAAGAALSAVLPAALRAHCRFACVRDGALVFLADDAAWATQLRFHGPRLLAIAQGECQLDADRLTIRVRRQGP